MLGKDLGDPGPISKIDRRGPKEELIEEPDPARTGWGTGPGAPLPGFATGGGADQAANWLPRLLTTT